MVKESEKELAKGLYTNTSKVLKVVGWAVLYGIICSTLRKMNPETIIENWGIGLIGMTIFSLLYITPIDKLLFRLKKFYLFMLLFSLAWLISDWSDFIVIFIAN